MDNPALRMMQLKYHPVYQFFLCLKCGLAVHPIQSEVDEKHGIAIHLRIHRIPFVCQISSTYFKNSPTMTQHPTEQTSTVLPSPLIPCHGFPQSRHCLHQLIRGVLVAHMVVCLKPSKTIFGVNMGKASNIF